MREAVAQHRVERDALGRLAAIAGAEIGQGFYPGEYIGNRPKSLVPTGGYRNLNEAVVKRSEIEDELVGLRARAADHHRLVRLALVIREHDVAMIGNAFEHLGLAGAAHAFEAG